MFVQTSFSFTRYNEFSVLILCYLITFTEEAFQGKPVDILSWMRLHSEWFLTFPEVVEMFVLF